MPVVPLHSETLASLLAQTSDVRALAESLRRLRSDSRGGVIRTWYQGHEPYFDVFFETRGERLEWFQVTFRGLALTADLSRRLVRVERSSEAAPSDLPLSQTVLLERMTGANDDFVEIVRRLLVARRSEPLFAGAFIALVELLKERT